MKRITYVSQATRTVAAEELNEIAAVSVRNNARSQVTGILLLCGPFFRFWRAKNPA